MSQIPEPTAEDLAVDLNQYSDFAIGPTTSSGTGFPEAIRASFRRCVAAERDNAELRKRLARLAELITPDMLTATNPINGTLWSEFAFDAEGCKQLRELIHGTANAGEGV